MQWTLLQAANIKNQIEEEKTNLVKMQYIKL